MGERCFRYLTIVWIVAQVLAREIPDQFLEVVVRRVAGLFRHIGQQLQIRIFYPELGQ